MSFLRIVGRNLFVITTRFRLKDCRNDGIQPSVFDFLYRTQVILLFVPLLATSLIAFDGHDQAAIEKQLKKGFAAFAKQDWETVASLCTSDWVIVLHTGASLNLEGIKKFFAEHITEHTLAISNIQVHVSGDATMAWATFSEETSYKFDGNPVSENAVFTAIFVNEGDAWKMKMEQRTLVQPPPPMTEKE